ncbi:MAG TPA: chemotaxis protein CheW [Polyangia bacterium]|nr:chemotaxis protein CheW [Polyangia bacterium]
MKGTGTGLGRPRVGAVPAKKAAELLQLVAFSVGSGEYALDIMRIKEIINPVKITPVPKAPPFIEGVIELRGTILPVVDLRKRFDLVPTPTARSTKFLVVAIDVSGRRMIVALIVDGVSEPLRVPLEQVRAAPALAQGEAAYFSGVVHHGSRIFMILDLDAILSSREKITLAGLDGPPGGAA